ncbi:glutaredoxin-C4-like isoform X1 [Homalodisca vitripennis]|uniref:Glutaredoxin-2, mitochondrial n=2 Tax=Homalodisca liturata TaxID=320908 RepID=A0A1B6II66_9HEMI|nr:glutaredoxin-C4-like isoform X1 [Homalodisca vitripennis]
MKLYAIFLLIILVIGASKAINMNSAAAEFVKATISSDTVVIFSKTYCPYCKMAKEVFNNLKHKYTLIELDQREDGSEMQDVLGELTGARSVPRVFVKGKFVGGGTDVQALYNKGELQLMLAA